MQPSPVQITKDQKQPENVEYFNYLGSVITSHASCTRGIKSRIARAKATFNKKALFASKVDLNLRKTLIKCCNGVLCGAERQTLGKVDQKYLRSFEIWCWRRIEKINWTDRVRNEEVSHSIQEERNILRTRNRRKANCIGHILRRNCLQRHVTEGKIEESIGVTGRRGRRCKQLLDDRRETRRHWKLKY
jgi:hypothetical protein